MSLGHDPDHLTDILLTLDFGPRNDVLLHAALIDALKALGNHLLPFLSLERQILLGSDLGRNQSQYLLQSVLIPFLSRQPLVHLSDEGRVDMIIVECSPLLWTLHLYIDLVFLQRSEVDVGEGEFEVIQLLEVRELFSHFLFDFLDHFLSLRSLEILELEMLEGPQGLGILEVIQEERVQDFLHFLLRDFLLMDRQEQRRKGPARVISLVLVEHQFDVFEELLLRIGQERLVELIVTGDVGREEVYVFQQLFFHFSFSGDHQVNEAVSEEGQESLWNQHICLLRHVVVQHQLKQV